MRHDGSGDTLRAAASLAGRLPQTLQPLARLAYNYRWSWLADGPSLFRDLGPQRWEAVAENPVRLLEELTPERLRELSLDRSLAGRIDAAAAALEAELSRPPAPSSFGVDTPVCFLCAEFGLHRSLPIYSGGLGVLAGDILKESSDLALPLVGVGLLYRQGYFQQRVDQTGQQHEYWVPLDPELLPAALVTGNDGRPITVNVPVRGRDVVVQVWRVEVGRIPLYLLDADLPQNSQVDRWITGRLYVGDRAIRLAQYALLGVGAVRALRRMGFDPGLIHLNEGHAALATLELAREEVARGSGVDAAVDSARQRTIFTTHTPVAAGNEGYDNDEIASVLAGFPAQLGLTTEAFLRMGRVHPDNAHEGFGMTPLGIRIARAANGVSDRHGEVAREMWQPLFASSSAAEVPIGSVTNGVHLPTWMAAPMRELLDRHLGGGWQQRAGEATTWAGVESIPDAELWATRCRLRSDFLSYLRERVAAERLGRYESAGYVQAALDGFDPELLTIGFARRVATYKRLHVLTYDGARAVRILGGHHPVQLVLAGKAHPQDDEGKATVRRFFDFKKAADAPTRVAYLDNYDMGIAAQLVGGCDVWLNVPRPPLEASGTSGMKSALNGGLNLSVLDGWWCEGFDGSNGWGLSGEATPDPAWQDSRDAQALYDTLENEVAPLFYERDADGVPTAWVRRVKASLRTCGPRFSATRMMGDYVRTAYERNGPAEAQ
ncbi:MAG: glycosyltransferase family 1 protein [Candidatus Dormibacteria bacterium]